MKKSNVVDLGNRIHMVDLKEGGVPARTGSYIISDSALTIVETGTSPSIPYVLQGLNELGFKGDDVKYIILTHIHLDHAGGAGLLLEYCPNATIIAHPKAAIHLIDPSRLIAGAKAVYGHRFDELFDPILPIPENRLLIKHDGETLEIGPGRTLTFFETLGHASHHHSIYDPYSNGMFTGDAAGTMTDVGSKLYLPSMSPNQFNPEQMVEVLDQIKQMDLERIYFGHYGMTDRVNEALSEVKAWIPKFVEAAENGLKQQKNEHEIAEDFYDLVAEHLKALGVSENHAIYESIPADLYVYAMGVADYLRKAKRFNES